MWDGGEVTSTNWGFKVPSSNYVQTQEHCPAPNP